MHFRKRSPVSLPSTPLRTEERGGWLISLEYENQGEGPWLIDLSHKPKWDLQSPDLSEYQPGGLDIPEGVGQSLLQGGWLINRMNGTQASIWRLGPDEGDRPPDPSAFSAYTETTDAHALMALIGTGLVQILELYTVMELFGPDVDPPALFQGPILRVPSQVVRLLEADKTECVLIACAGGYGRTMADAMLSMGRPYGLVSGGEELLDLSIHSCS